MKPKLSPQIGIVIGPTRPNLFGEKPAAWIHGIAGKRAELDFEVIDLRDYPLPVAQRWGHQAGSPRWLHPDYA